MDSKWRLRHTRAQLARIWMRQGKHNLARAWAAELDLNLDQPPEFAHVDEYLVALELLAHDGQSRRALASLDLAIELAQENGHRHNLLQHAAAEKHPPDRPGEVEGIDCRAQLSTGHCGRAGYVRPFLAFGSELEEQLQELSVTSKHARFVRRLLEQMRRDRQQGESPEEAANPLSKRQTEIMRLVAAGLFESRHCRPPLHIRANGQEASQHDVHAAGCLQPNASDRRVPAVEHSLSSPLTPAILPRTSRCTPNCLLWVMFAPTRVPAIVAPSTSSCGALENVQWSFETAHPRMSAQGKRIEATVLRSAFATA